MRADCLLTRLFAEPRRRKRPSTSSGQTAVAYSRAASIRRAGFAGLLALSCAFGGQALAAAGEASPAAANPALEARMMALSHKLRCLVCQNQSIAESDAPLAQDLRGQVREQLAAGRSDDQILDYLVARYGDFVLYEPPLRASTLLLWAGPLALLVAGLGWLGWRLRRRQHESPPPLTPDQQARARALLDAASREDFRS